MNQSDIDKLLALRSAWDKFKIAKKKAHKDFEDFYQVFWSYGMEARHELAAFNDAMCVQLLREQYPLRGECDLCKGYDGEPPCTTILGNVSCAATGDPQPVNYDMAHPLVLMSLRFGILPPMKGDGVQIKEISSLKGQNVTLYVYDNKFSSRCPPGHGYYFDYFIPIEDKKPFDLTWVP
jgi:hypothetical protein